MSSALPAMPSLKFFAECRKQARGSGIGRRFEKVLEDNKRALIEKHKQEELEARRQKKMELEQALARENGVEKNSGRTAET